MKPVAISAVFAALAVSTPVHAGVNDDVRLCRAAVEARVESGAAIKFDRYFEGRARVVRFMVRVARGGERAVALCRIERGAVAAVEIKARRTPAFENTGAA
jgi:hypothetical protein